MALYNLLLLAVLVLGAPFWLLRMATSGRYRAGLAGRLGKVPAALQIAVAGHQVIWIHAVSVGEVMAATQLIRELKAALPGWVIAVSTTTETGQKLARERFADSPVFYLPLDFAFMVRRYLQILQPKMLILIESELWPHLIGECSKGGIPVAVVNARISDRSFPRYLRLRKLWRPSLMKISLYLAQSRESAERLLSIGAPEGRVRTTGNLKYDIRPNPEDQFAGMLRTRLPADAGVLVCGSTLDGEERILLEAWPELLASQPKIVMVLAPRHPDRFNTVAEAVVRRGFPLYRASEFIQRPAPIPAGAIFLLDTIGDLAGIYALATLAFVGGSLIAAGGHNPLEPAQFAVPVVMGPSWQNFREVVEAMRSAGAIEIVTPPLLAETLIKLLREPERARTLGERGQMVCTTEAGATNRTVAALLGLLGKSLPDKVLPSEPGNTAVATP